MKRPLLPLIVLSAITAGCGSTPKETAPEAAAVKLQTVRVQSSELAATFEAGGIVRGRSIAPIASRILAPVVDVHVRAGDRVRRNAPLVTLDGREIAANRTQAAAALAGSVESARAAEGAVRSAEAAVTLARATHERIRVLHGKRSATAQELDQATSALAAADAQLTSARANLAASTAARDAARAASDAVTIAGSYTVLRAPFDGIVTERSVDPGVMATPGVPLLTIEDPAAQRLEVAMDEARASQVELGQTVDVQVGDAGTAAWTPARVGEVARIDPASHSFLVKIDLPKNPGLRSGAFGRARFAGPSRKTVVVPSTAIVRRGQLAFVFVVPGDGRARLQPVSIGAVSGDRVEVLTGVSEGDQIVASPPASLLDGTPVGGVRP
ncbi:MAG TPA: efflux RND transporter periplasmic adaptor subunit [Vicinamibacterales bacterium]|nr:efflux RND transporter periplasmic adaptor subunit [Vicinamibacterales bacterium]